MKLKDVEATVNELLITIPDTRNNDNELVYQFLRKRRMPTDYYYLREYGTSVAETVCRAKRKCVERNPSLKGNKRVTARREVREQEYRETMRGV